MQIHSYARPIRQVLFIALALVMLVVPLHVSAAPADELPAVLPDGSKFIIGVNMEAMRTSPFYADAMGWVRTQSSIAEVLDLLQKDGEFDVERDLKALALGSPELPQSMDAVRSLPFTVVLAGSYKTDKVLGAIQKRYPDAKKRTESGLDVVATSDYDIGFVNESLIAIVSGKTAYQKTAWKALGTAKGSRNPKFKQPLVDLGPKHGAWILMDTSDVAQAEGPKSRFAALGFEFSRGLALTMLTYMSNEADAKLAAEQLEQLKTEAGNNPMVGILGLTPLVNNLAVKLEKSTVRTTSSMTEPEARSLATRVRQIAERSQAMQAPKGPIQPRKQPATSPPAPRPSSGGAAADFN